MGAVHILRRAVRPAKTRAVTATATVEAPATVEALAPAGRVSYATLPATLCGYRLQEVIGAGGTSTVYRAAPLEGEEGSPCVALKLLKPHGEAGADQLLHELRVLQSLQHPNVIEVVDFGRAPDGRPWMAFPHVQGVELRALLRDHGPLPPARALGLMRQLLGALDAAHRQHVVHLDLKPSNILVSQAPEGGDHLTLLDFGLARCMDRLDHWNQTPAGPNVGTPRYMAPELLRGDAVGPFCDVYAAGLILFELLTGAPAFVGASPHEVIVKQLLQPLQWPAHLRTPDLDMLLAATTHKDWQQRVSSAAVFLEALDIAALPSPAAAPAARARAVASSQPAQGVVGGVSARARAADAGAEVARGQEPAAPPAQLVQPAQPAQPQAPRPRPVFVPPRRLVALDLSEERALARALMSAEGCEEGCAWAAAPVAVADDGCVSVAVGVAVAADGAVVEVCCAEEVLGCARGVACGGVALRGLVAPRVESAVGARRLSVRGLSAKASVRASALLTAASALAMLALWL